MNLLYFQNSVETFNIKMSIKARLLIWNTGYSQLINKLHSTKAKAVRSTGYIQIKIALHID